MFVKLFAKRVKFCERIAIEEVSEEVHEDKSWSTCRTRKQAKLLLLIFTFEHSTVALYEEKTNQLLTGCPLTLLSSDNSLNTSR